MSGTRVVSLAWFRSPRSAYEDSAAGDWSEGRFFPRHFPAILRAYLTWFPGWKVRIHHDGQVWRSYYGGVLMRLQRMGLVELVHMGESSTLCGSMLWRMMPAFDHGVELFIARDLDSMPSPRERSVVQEWVESGAAVHAVHDSTSHNGTPLMGGMIGARGQRFRELTGIRSYPELLQRAAQRGLDLNNHGSDQVLLNLEAWPRVRRETMIHKLKGGGGEGAGLVRTGAAPGAECAWASADIIGACNGLSPHIGAIFPHYQPVGVYNAYAHREVVPENIQHALRSVIEAEQEAGEEVGVPKPVDAEGRVLYSSDLNQDYAFYLPLSAMVWRAVTGLRSAVILVGTPAEWEANARCWFAARLAREKWGAELYFVPRCEGHRDSTVAQVARLYGGLLPLPGSSYLITADADMWPLSPTPFRVPMGNGRPFTVNYANAYLKDVGGTLVPEGKYPICYLAGSVAAWREIMQLPKVSGRIGEEIHRQLDAGLGRNSGSDSAWNYDELLFGVRFHEWPRHESAMMHTRRGQPPVDRVDRSCWPEALDAAIAKGYDAHLPRPAYTDQNWAKLRPIINAKASAAMLEWSDAYRADFLAIPAP